MFDGAGELEGAHKEVVADRIVSVTFSPFRHRIRQGNLMHSVHLLGSVP